MLIFQAENRPKLKELVALMLPMIGTQLAIMGMAFFDASMSGQAGKVELAGAAIGSNIWAPLHTGFGGILMAAMPISANYLGAGDKAKISRVIRQGLFLAVIFGLLIILSGMFCLPWVLGAMGLENEVYRVAQWYLISVAIGIIPFFLTIPLRSLVDTLGYTNLSMKLFLLALPINACLNYVFIFGKLGFPRLGGIGAGVATGLTYWLMLGLFIYVVSSVEPFKDFKAWGASRPDKQLLREYMKIGIPMGFSIFLEVTIFCVVAFFMAKYGTQVIAAHQAAMNFSCLIYMIPLSFSMALTITVGIAHGAGQELEAKKFSRLGLELSVLIAAVYLLGELVFRHVLSGIYSADPEVRSLIERFILFAMVWQIGDTVGAPCQGVLRGYKDVNATFWSNVMAFWVICLPVGLLLERYTELGPFSYWTSLVMGVGCSAVFLMGRVHWLQAKLVKAAENNKNVI